MNKFLETLGYKEKSAAYKLHRQVIDKIQDKDTFKVYELQYISPNRRVYEAADGEKLIFTNNNLIDLSKYDVLNITTSMRLV